MIGESTYLFVPLNVRGLYLCTFYPGFAGEKDLDDWRLAEVNLNAAFRILVIEAWIGERTYNFETSYGDICVDDIEIKMGGCQKQLTIYGKSYFYFSASL